MVVVTRAGRLWEWSQGELQLFVCSNNKGLVKCNRAVLSLLKLKGFFYGKDFLTAPTLLYMHHCHTNPSYMTNEHEESLTPKMHT